MSDSHPMSSLTLQLFGSPRLEKDGLPVELGRRKALALLIYLAVTGRSHSRDRLAALFWPQHSQTEARADLRRLLSVLNKALGDGWLVVDYGGVALRRCDTLRLDVDDFRQRLSTCEAHGHSAANVCRACLPELGAAVALYRDDFLVGFSLPDSPDFDEWQYFEAESLRRQLASALERLAQGHRDREEWELAVGYARRWLALDPLQEPVHRHLMQLYVWSGQRQAALRQYRICVETLGKELGVKPTPETTALYEQIMQNVIASRGMEATPADDRPMDHGRAVAERADARTTNRAGEPPRHNLPTQATPFVGRKQELAGILDHLQDPACRLLSLVGPGGMGKSRLAIQAAQMLVDVPLAPALFGHGVWVVQLAPITSPAELVAAIAETLGIPFYSEVPPRDHLLHHLAERALLLVLDNFEHLLDSVDLVADILVGAPAVKVLVTSREALNLKEEWFHPVHGMSTPATAAQGPAGENGEAMDTYDAVQLFGQSARRARPGFTVSQDLQAVIRICQLVEGMPLGIELAAAWLKVFSCKVIADQIERNRDFLTSRLQNTPARHRSMRAVFEHSWRLLAEAERDVLAQLSIFRGGFRLEAAVQVAGASALALASLVEKSLLRAAEDGRYHMHELLRQYAEEKLSAVQAEQTVAHNRHGTYYLGFLQAREQALNGRDQHRALAEIGEEMDNIRAAWHWAVRHGGVALLDRGLEGLYQFCQIRGRYQEGVEILEQAIHALTTAPLAEEGQSSSVLQKSLARCGALYCSHSRAEPAKTYLELSLSSARALDQPAEIAFSLRYLGEVAHWLGKYSEAKQRYLISLAISRGIGDQPGAADALQMLAEMGAHLEDAAETKRLALECLAICREMGRPDWIAKALDSLGAVAFYSGSYAESKAYYQESLALSSEIGDLLVVAYALGGLAWLAWAKGEDHYAEARRLAEESLATVQECGHQTHIGSRLMIVGLVLTSSGQFLEAQKCYQTGLAIGRSFADFVVTTITTGCLAGLGEVSRNLGDFAASRSYLLEALKTAVEAQVYPRAGEALVYYATLLAEESERPQEPSPGDKKTQAIELLALVIEHPACWRIFKDRAARLLAELETRFPEHVSAAAKTRGQNRTLEEAVAGILQSESATATLNDQ